MWKCVLGAMLFLIAHTANAQELACASKDGVLAALKESHGETMIFDGLLGKGPDRIIITASKEKRTWTEIMVIKNGQVGCLITAGTNFDMQEGGGTWQKPIQWTQSRRMIGGHRVMARR